MIHRIRQISISLSRLMILMGLFSLVLCGCTQSAEVKKIPTPSPEDKTKQAAFDKRMAELKKQYPNMPEAGLAVQISHEQNGH